MWRRERKNLESKLKAWMNESLTSVVMDWWLAHRLMAMDYAGNVANWHVLGSVKPTHSQSAVAHESVTHVACRLHGGHPSPLAGCGTFSCFFFLIWGTLGSDHQIRGRGSFFHDQEKRIGLENWLGPLGHY